MQPIKISEFLFQVFDESFSDVLTRLNECVLAIPSLANDRCFHPFTQPILYGKIEFFDRPGNGEEQHFVDGHEKICNSVLVNILTKETISKY